ncbi:hypothetical protein HDU76_001088 [Blyttiomyces sp. JEL0837]|nr:hypothetical protein HDU76_001088 [Blyttiomyces sp. JEL0837]
MEAVIVTAVVQNQSQMLRHFLRTGTDIDKIAGSQSLVAATNSPGNAMAMWLINSARVIPTDLQHFPTIITNCYKRGHMGVLQKLVDSGNVTATMLGMRLLSGFDELNSSFKLTIFDFIRAVNWLVKSEYWDSIEISPFSEKFLARALKANYLTLLSRMFAFGFWSKELIEVEASKVLTNSVVDDKYPLIMWLTQGGIVLENVGGRWKVVRNDDAVVDIEKGTFIFSTAGSMKPVTSFASGGSTSSSSIAHVFGSNTMGSVTKGAVVQKGSVFSVVGTQGSTPLSFSATSVGDSLRSNVGSPGNGIQPQAFGAARGSGSRSRPGSRPHARLGGR